MLKIQEGDKVRLKTNKDAIIIGVPGRHKYYARMLPRKEFVVLSYDDIEFVYSKQPNLFIC